MTLLMPKILFRSSGGDVALPNADLVLVDRADGGNLIVSPAREVWDRSGLSAEELTRWSFLVAATGRAMIDVLPQLANGCINYWDAGNWALNIDAEPKGVLKSGPEHRRLHLHVLGRSREAKSPSWKWGEAPYWSSYTERHAWAKTFQRLTAEEARTVVARIAELLQEKYGVAAEEIEPWRACPQCKYPHPGSNPTQLCAECGTS
jgi:hypothetical protein